MKMIRDRQLDLLVLLLSGYVEKEDALDAIELGTFSILEKPISFDKMKLVVERMMNEVELNWLRSKIRQSTLPIREIYKGIREAILSHVPEDVLNRFFIEADYGVMKRELKLGQVLTQLDRKLDFLLKAEKSLLEIRKRDLES
jgi:CheY-like chemotaxis protein